MALSLLVSTTTEASLFSCVSLSSLKPSTKLNSSRRISVCRSISSWSSAGCLSDSHAPLSVSASFCRDTHKGTRVVPLTRVNLLILLMRHIRSYPHNKLYSPPRQFSPSLDRFLFHPVPRIITLPTAGRVRRSSSMRRHTRSHQHLRRCSQEVNNSSTFSRITRRSALLVGFDSTFEGSCIAKDTQSSRSSFRISVCTRHVDISKRCGRGKAVPDAGGDEPANIGRSR